MEVTTIRIGQATITIAIPPPGLPEAWVHYYNCIRDSVKGLTGTKEEVRPQGGVTPLQVPKKNSTRKSGAQRRKTRAAKEPKAPDAPLPKKQVKKARQQQPEKPKRGTTPPPRPTTPVGMGTETKTHSESFEVDADEAFAYMVDAATGEEPEGTPDYVTSGAESIDRETFNRESPFHGPGMRNIGEVEPGAGTRDDSVTLMLAKSGMITVGTNFVSEGNTDPLHLCYKCSKDGKKIPGACGAGTYRWKTNFS